MNLEEKFHRMDKESIEEFVREGRDEDLHLEFKTVNSSDLSNPDDRKNLAKALSGFANSAGGLIVWGVATGNRTAKANEKKEIKSLSTFKMKLEEHTASWVSPPPNGVLHKAIPISEVDMGCAVTFVPESDSVPHMNNFDHSYYKRNGSRFLPMENYEVADMFGRRKRPKLVLACELEIHRHVKHGNAVEAFCKAVIAVRNEGRGTAKFPFLALSVHAPYRIDSYELDGNGGSGLPRINRRLRGKRQYAAGVDTVIHPGVTLQITRTDDIKVPIPSTSEPRELIIDYEISAEDTDVVQGTVAIQGEKILDFVNSIPVP